ncbi:MAG: LysM peptidoglycan-binding domain-containing protein [Propioniciclava sp.]
MTRRFLAWSALITLVVAPPLLLSTLGFTAWGSLSLASPTDVRLLLALLTGVGWIAWVGWLIALAGEVAALRSRRPPPVLPGFRWGNALASALLTAAITTGIPGPALAAPPPLVPTEEPTNTPTATPAPDPEDDARDADHGLERAGNPPDHETDAEAGDDTISHVVEPGDDLWSLAEYYYGDGSAWRTMVAANPQLQPDPTANLDPGTRLSIVDPVRLIRVVRGDTLSGIAADHLGEADRWPEIHRLNRDRVADPDVIDVGWILRLPWEAGEPTPPSRPAPGSGSEDSAAAPGPSAEATALAPDPEPSDDEADTATADGLQATEVTEVTEVTAEDPGDGLDVAAVTGVTGGLTMVTASAVISGLALRQRLQDRTRGVGRRFASAGVAATRARTALELVGPPREPDRKELLARAMRHLADHWHREKHPVPGVETVVLGDLDLEFRFDTDPGVPPGFQRIGNRLAIAWSRLQDLEEVSAPVAFPALVTLGEDDDHHLLMVDLVAAGSLGIRGDGARLAAESLSAMLVELACAPWAAEVQLLVVTEDEDFAHIAGSHRVTVTADVSQALTTLEQLVSRRQQELGTRAWSGVRLDPDLAEAWTPFVVLVEVPLSPEQQRFLIDLVEGTPCGVAAALPVGADAGEAAWEVIDHEGAARVRTPDGHQCVAQTLPGDTRAALGQLFTLADAEASDRAPWWAEDPEEPVRIVDLRPAPALSGPRVRLLGPIGLDGAASEPPARAVGQCIEYCAWLLEHPGGTPSEMTAQLFVSDATRRSNLSRLRSWLGSDTEGALYLPDAYSGRIHLHPDVTSDWQDLLTLTEGGINRMPDERLRAALDLVRGAPLADAAPGQWGWAEEVRSEMSALIRDLGVVASRKARERNDLDGARWAANRALVAAPEDELLLGERIRAERASGRTDEVMRLVNRLNRQVRTLGVDLLPETVSLIQEVVEGRHRSRVSNA